MKLPPMPALPFDQADRQAIGTVLAMVGILAFVLLTVAAVLGISLRVFLLASGLGG